MEHHTTTAGSADPSSSSARGVDAAPQNRPGVPMETEPHPAAAASWDAPPRQSSGPTHFKRKGLPRLTPVYGTAQPPRGLSGVMRRAAYDIPEHKPSHWALLLAADRVDVVEHGLARMTSDSGVVPVGRTVRERPMLALLVAGVAGLMVARAVR